VCTSCCGRRATARGCRRCRRGTVRASTPLAATLRRALSLSGSSKSFPTVTFLVSQGHTTTPAGAERDIPFQWPYRLYVRTPVNPTTGPACFVHGTVIRIQKWHVNVQDILLEPWRPFTHEVRRLHSFTSIPMIVTLYKSRVNGLRALTTSLLRSLPPRLHGGCERTRWMPVDSPEDPVKVPMGKECTASSSGLEMRFSYRTMPVRPPWAMHASLTPSPDLVSTRLSTHISSTPTRSPLR